MTSDRRRTLVVSGFIPAQNASQAGHKTAFRNIQEIKREGDCDVVLFVRNRELFLRTNDLDRLRSLVDGMYIISIGEVSRLLSMIWFGIFLRAPRFFSRHSLAAKRFIKLLFEDRPYHSVRLEFSQTFWVSAHIPDGVQLVLSSHDLQQDVVSKSSILERAFFRAGTLRTEHMFFNLADQIEVHSERDRTLLSLADMSLLRKVVVRNPPLGEFLQSVTRSEETIVPFTLLFWGAMGRIENHRAVMDFLSTHFGKVKDHFPSVKLYVVGSDPRQELLRAQEKWGNSVVVTGFVEDPRCFFELASLGIAPLKRGAGIKVKVLEMLEVGMPVLTTRVGAEGIPENSRMVIVRESDFFKEILNFWSSRCL